MSTGFVLTESVLGGLSRSRKQNRLPLCPKAGADDVLDPLDPASDSRPLAAKTTHASPTNRKLPCLVSRTTRSPLAPFPIVSERPRSISLTQALFYSPRVRRTTSPSTRVKAPVPLPAYRSGGTPGLGLAMVGVSLGERMVFFLGEFLTWNSFSKIQAMFAVSLVFVFIGAYLFRLADPEGNDASSPLWRAIRGVVNPFEDDFEMTSTRTISVLLSFVGILFFGILIGIITEGVENGVVNLGNSTKVAVSNHTLFCGWNSHVPQMIKDLSDPRARSRPGKAKIVILAPCSDQQEMIDKIRDTVNPKDLARVKIFVRNGRPVRKEDLEKVGANRAAKIVLVGNEELSRAEASRDVLSRAIALKMAVPEFKGEVISEAHSERDEAFVKSIVGSTTARGVHTIAADVLLGRLVAQAIHQPGLFNVISMMMSTDPTYSFDFKTVSEIAPDFVGQTYTNLRDAGTEHAIICGYLDSRTGMPKLVPVDDSLLLKASTQLVMFGKAEKPLPKVAVTSGKGTVVHAPKGEFDYEGAAKADSKPQNQRPQSILLCGWKANMQDMLTELDETVARGSIVTLLADESCGCHGFADIDPKALRNLRVKPMHGSPDYYDDLEMAVKQSKCTEAVVLSLKPSESSDDVEADSRVLSSLVYLDAIVRSSGSEVMLNATFQQERTAALATKQLRVENILMSKVIGAKLSSQAVRDGRVNHVWRELLSQEGREVYLRPTGLYIKPFGKASFKETCKFAAAQYNEIVIGYRKLNGQIVLNPNPQCGRETQSWAPGDNFIVLAE